MAVSHKKFRNADGKEVRAIRVTERNYSNVGNWVDETKTTYDTKVISKVHVDKSGDLSDHRISLRVPNQGIRVARVGDWIVRDAKEGVGIYFRVAKDEFEKEFKLVK